MQSRYGISSFIYRARRPFHPKRLFNLVHDKFIVIQNIDEVEETEGEEDNDNEDEETDEPGEDSTEETPDHDSDTEMEDDLDDKEFAKIDPEVSATCEARGVA